MVTKAKYEALQKEFTNYKLEAEAALDRYKQQTIWFLEDIEDGRHKEEIDSLKIRVFDRFIGGKE